uniref:Transparent testa 12 protein n=1 Tax=Zea mays TaxID=4577 RepID=B6UD60_MAIZE|nr:transparent testa 12 protein [Zea mays]
MGSSSGAPLLVAHPSRGKEDLGDQRRLRWCCGVSSEGRWAEATAEAGRLAALAAPMIAVALLQLMMQVISTIMVGHLGEVPLAGAAIAGSLTNVSGFSVLMGLACGLETICGQAFGAEQYHKVALYTYRSIVVLLIASVPMAILWVFLPDVLPLIGQDPQIAIEAGRYALWLIPGLFAFSVAQCLSKFLQSQSLIFPLVLSSLTTLAVFIPLCWFMVYKVGMGNAGAAFAVSICDWVEVTVLGLYIKFSPSCEKTRAPFTWEAFQGIGSFMRLAVPSALMVCLEWWSYELLVLLSGMLPNAAQAAHMTTIDDNPQKPKGPHFPGLSKDKISKGLQTLKGKLKPKTEEKISSGNKKTEDETSVSQVDQIKMKYGYANTTNDDSTSVTKMIGNKLQENMKKLEGINLRAADMASGAQSFSTMAKELLRTTKNEKGTS